MGTAVGEGPDGAQRSALVARALAELGRLPELPVDEHVAVFETVHGLLVDALVPVEPSG